MIDFSQEYDAADAESISATVGEYMSSLTDEEKARLCQTVADGEADYIKTSTGFSRAGATPADVEIFAANRPKGLLIKAAGGISSFADAQQFIALGADRLGTSRLVKIAKEEDANK